MAFEDEVTDERLRWLIVSRSRIQQLSARVLFLLKAESTSNVHNLGLAVGACFSLWRAVFLADHESSHEDTIEAGIEYLEKVIRLNTITFSDDISMRGWAFGFYLNNARFRIKAMCDLWPEYETILKKGGLYESTTAVSFVAGTTEAWTDCYRALELFVNYLRGI